MTVLKAQKIEVAHNLSTVFYGKGLTDMKPEKAIRRPAVVAMTGLSATTIYEMEKRGEFPRHWMQSPRVAVWDEDEVCAFIAGRRARPIARAAIPDQSKRKSFPGRGGRKAIGARLQAALTALELGGPVPGNVTGAARATVDAYKASGTSPPSQSRDARRGRGAT